MSNVLSQSTVRTYQKAWSAFRRMKQCILHEEVSLPVSVSSVTLFVTYLYVYQKLAPGTIRTYLSGISFTHKMKNISDPVLAPPVSKLLHSLTNAHSGKDARLPITRPLLKKLIKASDSLQFNPYDLALYKCMFLLAWHACLRLSEFTTSTGNLHCINFANLCMNRDEHGVLDSYCLEFTSFKHKMGHYPALSIKPYSVDSQLCAFTALQHYLKLRGKSAGPLFLWKSLKPVTRSGFAKLLRQCVKVVDPNLAGCTSHSFRIGRATQAIEDNMPVEKLIKLGRWKSTAFRKYCRPPVLQVS